MNKLGLHNFNRLVDDYIIASTTDLDGIITYVSNLFCKMSGYTKDELIGKSHNFMRHPDMPKSAFEDMWNTIQSGQIWKGEVKNLTKDGGFYWVDSVVSPIVNEDGETIGYKSFRFDITGYKELDRQKKEAQALTNTLNAYLMDDNFDIEKFKDIVNNNISKDSNPIHYIEPELW
jgi:PAS domain S-box-containing protein